MANDSDSGLSRRGALKIAGAAGMGLLAGCGGGDGNETTTTAGDGGGDGGGDGDTTTTTTTTTTAERSDRTFRYAWARDSPLGETNTNLFAPNEQHELSWIVYAEQGNASVSTGEWVNLDVADWEFDAGNNELRVTIKEGVDWHQGGEVIDPVTGEDWAMQHEIERLLTQTNPDASVSDDPTVVGWDYDGKTEIRQLNEKGFNRAVLENGFPRSTIQTYREDWRPTLEQLRDASTDDERSSIRNEVIQRSVVLADDPPLSGPYMLDSVSAQSMEMTRSPNHWSREHVNWDDFEVVKLSASSGAKYQAAVSDRIDFNVGIPDTVDSPPPFVKQVNSAAGSSSGYTLSINYGGEMDPWFGFEGGPSEDSVAGKRQAKARQAIAYAVHLPDITRNEYGRVADTLAPVAKGVPGNPGTVERKLPDVYEAAPSFVEAQPEKAEQALRESGLSKEGGTWVKPDGSPLTVNLESHSWSRPTMETIKSDLEEIGVEAEHVVQESSVLFSRQSDGSTAASQAWWGTVDPIASVVLTHLVDGWPEINQPPKYEVPPFGEYDAEPSETVDVRELSSALQTTSFEQHEEELRKLAWVFTYHQPMIQLTRSPSATGYNSKYLDFPNHPSDDDGDGRITASADDSAIVWTVDQNWRQQRKGVAQGMGVQAKDAPSLRDS